MHGREAAWLHAAVFPQQKQAAGYALPSVCSAVRKHTLKGIDGEPAARKLLGHSRVSPVRSNGLTAARTPQGYNYAPALISVGGRKLRALDGKAASRKLLGGMSAGGKAAAKKPGQDIEASQDLVFRQSYENCAPAGQAFYPNPKH